MAVKFSLTKGSKTGTIETSSLRGRRKAHGAGYHDRVHNPGISPKSMTPMRHIIAILLQNEAGALARVAGLFSTRGYNIESLSVAPTDDPTVSRLTLVTKGSDAVIQQIANQLNKLVDVVNVEDMTLGEHLERELVLLKLKVRPERTDTVRGHVIRLGGRVLDPAADGFIVELTGSEAEVNTFISELARDAELLEVVRSGALGIARNARPLRVVR
jgi:acetolactate synthase I/III small subunit